MDTFFDCHTHTEFSSCAEDVTLQGYVAIARAGSQQFAITDHSAQIFYPPDNRWGFWTEDAVPIFEANIESGRERIVHYIETIRAAQCDGMFVGTELDVLPDGRKVFPEGLLGTLDVVLGAGEPRLEFAVLLLRTRDVVVDLAAVVAAHDDLEGLVLEEVRQDLGFVAHGALGGRWRGQSPRQGRSR